MSGVQKELQADRLAVQDLVENDTLLKDYFNVFLFEKAPAGNKTSRFVYLKGVCDGDVYIVILGNEYGIVGKGKVSATEEEFRAAQKRSKYSLVLTYYRHGSKEAH